MKTSVYTTLISASVLSAVLTGLGLLESRFLMRMIQTSDNIFNLGDLYLRIYIGGFAFLFLYNVATGIFTSLGDSKTPLGNLYCPGHCLCAGTYYHGETPEAD